MPSVDGWKKRKPLVQQKPAVNPPLKTNGILVNKEEENPLHRISYGEAPARGHLPPAYIVSMMDFMHQVAVSPCSISIILANLVIYLISEYLRIIDYIFSFSFF